MECTNIKGIVLTCTNMIGGDCISGTEMFFFIFSLPIIGMIGMYFFVKRFTRMRDNKGITRKVMAFAICVKKREWIIEHHESFGFRNLSHFIESAIDKQIKVLTEEKNEE